MSSDLELSDLDTGSVAVQCEEGRVGRGRGGRFVAVPRTVLLVAAVGMAIAVSGGAAAAKSSSVTVKVSDAWARTSPMEAKNGAAYLVLENRTKKDNALVGASVPTSVAMETQVHETKMGPGGTMMMAEVPEIALAAKSTTKLEPGGYHIMLMNLAAPLEAGSKIKVTLEFQKGPKQTVKAVVKQ